MNYLGARGIDDGLAQFLVEYVKRKETLVSFLPSHRSVALLT